MSYEDDDDEEVEFDFENEALGLHLNTKSIISNTKRDFTKFIEPDDEEIDANLNIIQQPKQQENITFDINVNRPTYMVADSVSYYNLGSLFVLLYAHVSEGISIPSVFDKSNQSM